MLDEYLQKYADAFDDNFPIYAFMDVPDKEIIRTIKKCLKKNKPYVLDVKDGVLY